MIITELRKGGRSAAPVIELLKEPKYLEYGRIRPGDYDEVVDVELKDLAVRAICLTAKSTIIIFADRVLELDCGDSGEIVIL